MTTGRSSYQERMRKNFNIGAFCNVYREKGVLGDEALDACVTQTLEIRSLEIQDLDWVLIDHVLSVHRHVDLRSHFEALSAGFGFSFEGIGAFYRRAIEHELMPASMLNRTLPYRLPEAGQPLGDTLISLRLISEVHLQRALGIQKLIEGAIGTRVAVGQIFRSLSQLSAPDLFQALAVQCGVPYTDLDTSAPAVFEAAMSR